MGMRSWRPLKHIHGHSRPWPWHPATGWHCHRGTRLCVASTWLAWTRCVAVTRTAFIAPRIDAQRGFLPHFTASHRFSVHSSTKR